jgi:hypothetical protein
VVPNTKSSVSTGLNLCFNNGLPISLVALTCDDGHRKSAHTRISICLIGDVKEKNLS